MSWEKVKLWMICDILGGYAFQSEQYTSNEIPLVRISNITERSIVIDYQYTITESPKYSAYEIKKGDILVALSGATTGKFGMFTYSQKAYLNQRVGLIRAKANICQGYIFNYLNLIKDDILRKAGGAAQPNISTKELANFEIPLPPLPIQEKIAAILDKADALRRKDREMLKKYDELAQAIFIDMFGDPVKNEKGFKLGAIRDLTREVKYGTSQPAQENGTYPYLRMNNITYGGDWDFSSIKYINASDFDYLKYGLEYGDLIFNRTNSKDLVGKTAVYRSYDRVIIAGYLIRVRVNNIAHPDYISAYLNSKHGKLTLQNMCKNIVGQANINAQELQDIKILIPPFHLQETFAKKIELINQLKAQTNAEKSEELFQSLLQRAFRGELVS